MITVSVIMITYAHEKLIREAIEGVMIQEVDFALELIIADDCSPDKTESVIREIIETHPKSDIIKYTRHATNKGMISNFTWALEQCKGDYIALCEGDDYWTDPYKLQKQVNFLDADPEYILCFHPVKIKQLDGTIVDDFITNVPKQYQTQADLARNGNYIHTPTVVFKNIIHTFPVEFTQSPIGDYFLYMMLAQNGKIGMLADTMAIYRYQTGFWSKQNENVKIIGFLRTLVLLISYFKKGGNTKIIKIIEKRFKYFIHYYNKFNENEKNKFFESMEIKNYLIDCITDCSKENLNVKIKNKIKSYFNCYLR